MNVEVWFFASLREAAGCEALRLELAEPAGVEDLMRALGEQLAPTAVTALRAENVRVAVNQELARPPFTLADGDEVAFLPPVTGG